MPDAERISLPLFFDATNQFVVSTRILLAEITFVGRDVVSVLRLSRNVLTSRLSGKTASLIST